MITYFLWSLPAVALAILVGSHRSMTDGLCAGASPPAPVIVLESALGGTTSGAVQVK